MQTQELERTFLIKYLPENILNGEYKQIIDIYFPVDSKHPKLRLRKRGDEYELTKKTLVNEGDASNQIEQTITLSEDEYQSIAKLPGKKIHKLRYKYDYNGYICEIDVFKENLEGLILVDFEFDNLEDLNNFQMPDFCLADVTQVDFIAGGMLAGKTIDEVKDKLQDLNYSI